MCDALKPEITQKSVEGRPNEVFRPYVLYLGDEQSVFICYRAMLINFIVPVQCIDSQCSNVVTFREPLYLLKG